MHDPWLSQLPYYIAGALDPTERAALEAHLGSCETCRATLETWAAIAGAVREEAAERVGALPPLRQPHALSRNGHLDAPSPPDTTSIFTHHTENMENTPMVAHSSQITALRPAPSRFGTRAAPRRRDALTLIAVALLIAFAGAGALLLAGRLGDASPPAASAPGGEQPAGLGAQASTSTSTPHPLVSPTPENLSTTQATPTALIEHLPVTSTPIPYGLATLMPPTVRFSASISAVPLDYGLPARAEIEGVRYERQTWNNSGPAALAMALSALGWEGDQADTAKWLRADADDRSVMLWEMTLFVERETEFGALFRVGGVPALLKRLVAAGFPAVIPVGFEPEAGDWLGHHWVVTGYDDEAQAFLIYDSYLGEDQPAAIPYADLDAAWRQFNRAFMIVYQPEDRAEALDELAYYADPSVARNAAFQLSFVEAGENISNAWAAFNVAAGWADIGDYYAAAQGFDHAQLLGLPRRALWYRPEPYVAYYGSGNFDAVMRLADGQSQNAFFEEAAYWRGMVFAAQGLTDLARQEFLSVLDANPNYLPAQAALAELSLSELDVQVFPAGRGFTPVGAPLYSITESQGMLPPTPLMREEQAAPPQSLTVVPAMPGSAIAPPETSPTSTPLAR